MTTIVDGIAGVLMQSLTADGGEGANPKEAMRAALLWFAERLEAGDKICDPVGDAFWNCIDPSYKSGRQTQLAALAAAIRAAAGEEGK